MREGAKVNCWQRRFGCFVGVSILAAVASLAGGWAPCKDAVEFSEVL
jgi:hypothetical protein